MFHLNRLAAAVLAVAVLAGTIVAYAQPKVQTKAPASKAAAPASTPVTVYKTATCGCCGNWVQYMNARGYACNVTNLADLNEVKVKYGVPANLQSCHTSLIGGYVIEGHVPAEDVQRLLKEKPAIVGLAAPGMPPASPGMDVVNSPGYDVIAFEKNGRQRVYAKHPGK
jgi:hypothetical protein